MANENKGASTALKEEIVHNIAGQEEARNQSSDSSSDFSLSLDSSESGSLSSESGSLSGSLSSGESNSGSESGSLSSGSLGSNSESGSLSSGESNSGSGGSESGSLSSGESNSGSESGSLSSGSLESNSESGSLSSESGSLASESGSLSSESSDNLIKMTNNVKGQLMDAAEAANNKMSKKKKNSKMKNSKNKKNSKKKNKKNRKQRKNRKMKNQKMKNSKMKNSKNSKMGGPGGPSGPGGKNSGGPSGGPSGPSKGGPSGGGPSGPSKGGPSGGGPSGKGGPSGGPSGKGGPSGGEGMGSKASKPSKESKQQRFIIVNLGTDAKPHCSCVEESKAKNKTPVGTDRFHTQTECEDAISNLTACIAAPKQPEWVVVNTGTTNLPDCHCEELGNTTPGAGILKEPTYQSSLECSKHKDELCTPCATLIDSIQKVRNNLKKNHTPAKKKELRRILEQLEVRHLAKNCNAKWVLAEKKANKKLIENTEIQEFDEFGCQCFPGVPPAGTLEIEGNFSDAADCNADIFLCDACSGLALRAAAAENQFNILSVDDPDKELYGEYAAYLRERISAICPSSSPSSSSSSSSQTPANQSSSSKQSSSSQASSSSIQGAEGSLLPREVVEDGRNPNKSNEILTKSLSWWWPTPTEVIKSMMTMAKCKKKDVVYDLGCGDGRIPIHAAEQIGATGVGIDFDENLIRQATNRAKKRKVSDKVDLRHADALKVADLHKASVISLYILDKGMRLIKPIIKEQAKKGTRVISHNYKFQNWKPTKQSVVTDKEGHKHWLYLYIV